MSRALMGDKEGKSGLQIGSSPPLGNDKRLKSRRHFEHSWRLQLVYIYFFISYST